MVRNCNNPTGKGASPLSLEAYANMFAPCHEVMLDPGQTGSLPAISAGQEIA
jgi:hypothetical protein